MPESGSQVGAKTDADTPAWLPRCPPRDVHPKHRHSGLEYAFSRSTDSFRPRFSLVRNYIRKPPTASRHLRHRPRQTTQRGKFKIRKQYGCNASQKEGKAQIKQGERKGQAQFKGKRPQSVSAELLRKGFRSRGSEEISHSGTDKQQKTNKNGERCPYLLWMQYPAYHHGL